MNLDLLKKHLWLAIIGLAILAALAVAGVKLFAAFRLYKTEKKELRAAIQRKEALDRRTPYPSPANVLRETENSRDLLDTCNELNERLRACQAEPRKMQAVEFMTLLENTTRKLRKQLTDAQVAFPAEMRFSFERYAGGKPPAREDVPRLVQQLKIIEAICSALARVGVAELVAVGRDEFDAHAPARSAGAPAPRPDDTPGADALFRSQHFTLAVKGSEKAVLELLNLTARFPMFTAVASVEFQNPNAALSAGGERKAAAAAGQPKKAAGDKETAPRERLPIIGRELVELKMELDVYSFAPSLNFRENSGQAK